VSVKQIILLENNYKIMIRDFETLEADINKVEKLLKEVSDLLEVPVRLERDLKEYDNALILISDLLGAARLVPPISAEATETKNLVDSVKQPVHQVRLEVGKINQEIKPFKSKLNDVKQFLIQAKSWIKDADKFVTHEEIGLKSMHGALDGASVSIYHKIDEIALNAFCGVINTILTVPIRALHEMLLVLHEAFAGLGGITKLLHEVKVISNSLLKIIEELEVVIKPLQLLDRLLDKRVGIDLVLKSFKIKIRKLLTTTGHIPGFSKLMGLAMKTLKPALHSLKLDFTCEVPGLHIAMQKLDMALKSLNTIEAHFRKIELGFIHFHGPQSFISGIHGIDLEGMICKKGV